MKIIPNLLLLRLPQTKLTRRTSYKPFAEQCVEQRLAPAEVAYYIDRMAVPEERYGIYMKINMWNRALEMAHKLKDEGKLMQIRNLCKDEGVVRAVDHLLRPGHF